LSNQNDKGTDAGVREIEVRIMFVLAAAVTAFILGLWLAHLYTAARLSHSQRRMQKKVLYWQRLAYRHRRGEDGWRW
jgi:hypothetical protein